jgi:uncharacterized integral membrane protein
MRLFYVLVLVLFLAVIGVFAFQNQETVSLQFLQERVAWPLALIIGAVYILGMLSGWTVVGFLRRSWREVAEHQPR